MHFEGLKFEAFHKMTCANCHIKRGNWFRKEDFSEVISKAR